MFLVVSPEPGVVELNYTWLPTWMGMNVTLKEEIDRAIGPHAVGRPLTESVLLELHDRAVAFLVQKYPGIEGLGDYLDSLKHVSP